MLQLQEVPAEKFFYASDGKVIKSLHELPDALRNMSDETFAFHVNSEKNDFHNWALDVFNHSKVARKIKSVKTKETMAKRVFSEIYS